MSEVETGDLPAEEPVADETLDSIIESAIAESDTETADRARDEKGRFAAKETAEASETAPAEAETTAPQQDAKPAQQPLEPHPRWNDAEKADFAKLPAEGQKIVLERYKAMEADYTRKTQETAEFRKSAEPYLQAVQPFQQYLTQVGQQLGAQPAQLVGQLLAVEHRMRTGTTEAKVAALAEIAASYGIDLGAMSRGEVRAPDPILVQTQQQLSQLQAWKNNFEQQQQEQLHQQTSQTIEAFANTKSADGTPKYPHYDAVRGVMAQYLGSGEATTLEQAYEKATAPITAAVANELAKRQQTSDQARQDAVAKARNVRPVRSTGTAPRGNAQASSLDDIINQAISSSGIQ